MIWYITISMVTFVFEKVKQKLIFKFVHHNGVKLIKYHMPWHLANDGLAFWDWILV